MNWRTWLLGMWGALGLTLWDGREISDDFIVRVIMSLPLIAWFMFISGRVLGRDKHDAAMRARAERLGYRRDAA